MNIPWQCLTICARHLLKYIQTPFNPFIKAGLYSIVIEHVRPATHPAPQHGSDNGPSVGIERSKERGGRAGGERRRRSRSG